MCPIEPTLQRNPGASEPAKKKLSTLEKVTKQY